MYAIREYKDSLFRFLFKEKKELLTLYNALNHSNYTNPEDLEIVTLENVFFLKMKNDIAFLINMDELCLFEHTSTVCYNYPLRGFLYLAKEYEKILEMRGEKIHKRTLIKIPTPRYVVLYNGKEKRPERETFYLSDAFEKPDVEACVELKADIININCGMNHEILSACQTLRDYAILVSKVREYMAEVKKLDVAIKKAIDYCIENGHLKEFLIGYRAEVESMLLAEGSVEDYIEDMKQEQEQVIQEQEEIIREQSDMIQEQSDMIQEQSDTIREQSDMIQEQSDMLMERDNTIREQADRLQNMMDVMSKLEKKLAESGEQK